MLTWETCRRSANGKFNHRLEWKDRFAIINMIRTLQFAAAVFLLFASEPCRPAGAANPQPASAVEAADSLFKAGKFADAAKIYAQVAARDPQNYSAALHLGWIELLSNDLDNAQKSLQQARHIRPINSAVDLLLAEACYRRDDFPKAAAFLRAAGKLAHADTLASFQGVKPYDVQAAAKSTTLKLATTDPLPLVQVRINGGREAYFMLDTGASEVLLDADFARQLGVKQFGAEAGTFAGGKKSAVGHGKIGSITLGDWTVKHVPVAIVNTRQYSNLFGGKQIDGIIGTALLYHFVATIDYPEAKLILRRKTADNVAEIDPASDNTIVVPFWMAGDHFLVAWGKINNLDPMLLIVDTGSAGGAKLAETTLAQAGIKPVAKPVVRRRRRGRQAWNRFPSSSKSCRWATLRNTTSAAGTKAHFLGSTRWAFTSAAWSGTSF